MKELNIGKCIAQKRKEKGITQQQLANYIGVSKASVSKWESGLSYPDILLLPELATYFNISIDDLLGYSMQLTKEDIIKIYNKLSYEFSIKPFHEVKGKCDELIKKYYSCFPFLLSMIQLLLNYSVLVKEDIMRKEIFQQCILLSKRINDIFAIHIGAAQGYLINKNKEKAIDALDRYVKIVCNMQFPLNFKGNEYFTHVGKWFEDNNFIGTNTPIDETTMKKNFLNIVVKNPAFTALEEDERYKIFVEKLKEKLGEKNECNKCE